MYNIIKEGAVTVPCVYVETCSLKNILSVLPEIPPHNWLITSLDCCNPWEWDGCEK